MANVGNSNAPSGLRPVGTLGSAGYMGRIEVFATVTTDAAAIGIGDPVIITGEADGNGVPVVKRFTSNGTTGAVVSGVCVGIVPVATNLNIGYRPASSAVSVLCDTDPNTVYEVQEGSTSAVLTAAAVGSNAGLTMGTVDTTTGNGKTVLNNSAVGTTTALECKILRLAPKVGNLIGDNAKWDVMINNHQFRAAGTAGI